MTLVDSHDRAAEQFQAVFGVRPTLATHAGGRVNLIGEHTDYHEGFVFPAAIDLRTHAYAAPRSDGTLRIHSCNLNQQAAAQLGSLQPAGKADWSSYVLGPFWAAREAGWKHQGADVLITSNVPLGGGLSSSASVEVALVAMAGTLAQRDVDPMEAALLARRAENVYCGVPCGAMDQVASACGQRKHAIMLDCRSMQITKVPFPSAWALVVVDSGVKHSVAGAEYAKRQQECAEGMRLLRQVIPTLGAARDLTVQDLEQYRKLLPPLLYRRLRHVVTENARVLLAQKAMEQADAASMGGLLAASHESLARDYEVSCPELDTLVDVARGITGVIGARLTGAGFGGNTVNIVEAEGAELVCQRIVDGYRARTGRDPTGHVVRPWDGVAIEHLTG